MSYTLHAPTPSLLPAIDRASSAEPAWQRIGRDLLNWFEATGRARARNELLRLASCRAAGDSELTRQLRQAARNLG